MSICIIYICVFYDWGIIFLVFLSFGNGGFIRWWLGRVVEVGLLGISSGSSLLFGVVEEDVVWGKMRFIRKKMIYNRVFCIIEFKGNECEIF